MSRIRDGLKRVIGIVAEAANPALGREIDEAKNTCRAVKLKRAIHYARLRRAQDAGDIDTIERSLGDFWKGEQGNTFHDRFIEERIGYFLKHHSSIVDVLTTLPTDTGLHFSRLVEVGCGDGKALAYCVEHLPWVEQAIGIDINAAVIERASKDPSFDGRMAFVAAEARDWLAVHPAPGTVVLTNGGVLEYFAQANFDALLHALSATRPAAIALIEPAAFDHDLAGQTESFIFGHERSFSHNHRHRLSQAGFDLTFARELPIGKVRWMLMIGVRR